MNASKKQIDTTVDKVIALIKSDSENYKEKVIGIPVLDLILFIHSVLSGVCSSLWATTFSMGNCNKEADKKLYGKWSSVVYERAIELVRMYNEKEKNPNLN